MWINNTCAKETKETQMKFCKDCKHISWTGARYQPVIRPQGNYCEARQMYTSKTSMVTGYEILTQVFPDVLCDFNRSEEGLCKQDGLLFEQTDVPHRPPSSRIENTTSNWDWLGEVICGNPHRTMLQ